MASLLMTGSICLSDIPREQMKRVKCKDGKERVYLNIFVGERHEPKAFGERTLTHYVSCAPRKEERKDGVNYFIGDLSVYVPQNTAPTPEEIESAPCVGPDDDPDLPF